ncbi:class I SAM-dependent DNA methyltransferase, partial [Corynebacterium variabile]|uniref:class I SAM-dependent DNA methyltransferase n=2 Tax=Corynebacterium variabile TaxID=1727 RepID=UPI003BB0C697
MLRDENADEAVGDDAPTDPEEEDWQVQKTSVFLTRVLFLLYGDDAGLWEEDLFYRFVLYDTTGETLGSRLNALFQVLNTPENRRRRVPEEMAKFPYVNGSLFADQWPQDFFDDDMRDALLDACRFHWTRISPAVFGSMFQLVKSKEARRADGEHYTTETNILKVIEPLFLDELRGEADRLIRNKSTSAKDLRKFRDSLAQMIFLDPACGCGNFLVVAYRELRAIETDIIVALRAKEGQQTASMDVSLDQRMNIGQFHGFELNWWPAKIAETAMFLVDHQANRALAAAVGDAPDRLPITITAHIRHGNALQLGWEYEIPRTAGATYVFGNPPFLGQDTRSKDQLADLKEVWQRKNISRLDYVTAWHVKTAQLLADRTGDFAFVTTNSIAQGEQVPLLFGYLNEKNWHVLFAHRTFTWNSDAPGKAAVHCVIVGFSRDMDRKSRLWDYDTRTWETHEVKVSGQVNAYLIDGPEVIVEKAATPISPVINFAALGAMPKDGGGLVIESRDYAEVMADPVAAKYVRRYCGSRELVRGLDRWCLWLVDLEPADIAKSQILQDRLNIVRRYREGSTAASTQKLARTPHLFAQRFTPEEDFLCIPSVVSERRPYFTVDDLPAGTIVSSLAFAVEDPDSFQFAIASSSMFITWQRVIGGRMKSDLRFASTLTWHTLPLPEIDKKTRAAVIAAGQGVLEARGLHPERSLADAYNPLAMDPALVKAHDKLDRVVDKAFGADRKLTTERQRLEILFTRYAEMTAKKA